MNTRVHLALGVSTSVAFSYKLLQVSELGFSKTEMFALVSMAALGSVLPDVDHPNAALSRRLPLLSALLHKYYSSAGKYFGDYGYQYALLMHRGICHSFSTCLMAVFPISILLFMPNGYRIVSGLIWGMVLHIFMDTLTPMGCMLFAPFSTRRFSIYREKTKPNKKNHCLDSSKRKFYILLYIANISIGAFFPINIPFAFCTLVFIIQFINSGKCSRYDLLVMITAIISFSLHFLLFYLRKRLLKFYSKRPQMSQIGTQDVEPQNPN